MKFPTTAHQRAAAGLCGLVLMGAATLACAQVTPTGDTGIDASGSAERERAACLTGRTQQDQATCLKEANNAAAEKRKGMLDTQGNLTANALKRCNVLTGEDRAACEVRVLGYGNTSGSVAGGGVIREVETVVVPADATSVRIAPKTDAPVLLVVPSAATQ
jgi:hypothetical protein